MQELHYHGSFVLTISLKWLVSSMWLHLYGQLHFCKINFNKYLSHLVHIIGELCVHPGPLFHPCCQISFIDNLSPSQEHWRFFEGFEIPRIGSSLILQFSKYPEPAGSLILIFFKYRKPSIFIFLFFEISETHGSLKMKEAHNTGKNTLSGTERNH